MRETANTSVLVIDDEEMVRDNIEEILLPRKNSAESDSVDQAASILFDSPSKELLAPRTSNIPNFTVHKASNGMEGLELVKKIGSQRQTLCRYLSGYAYAGMGRHGNSRADQEI